MGCCNLDDWRYVSDTLFDSSCTVLSWVFAPLDAQRQGQGGERRRGLASAQGNLQGFQGGRCAGPRHLYPCIDWLVCVGVVFWSCGREVCCGCAACAGVCVSYLFVAPAHVNTQSCSAPRPAPPPPRQGKSRENISPRDSDKHVAFFFVQTWNAA